MSLCTMPKPCALGDVSVYSAKPTVIWYTCYFYESLQNCPVRIILCDSPISCFTSYLWTTRQVRWCIRVIKTIFKINSYILTKQGDWDNTPLTSISRWNWAIKWYAASSCLFYLRFLFLWKQLLKGAISSQQSSKMDEHWLFLFVFFFIISRWCYR